MTQTAFTECHRKKITKSTRLAKLTNMNCLATNFCLVLEQCQSICGKLLWLADTHVMDNNTNNASNNCIIASP